MNLDPLGDLGSVEVDQTLIDLATGSDNYHLGDTVRSRGVLGVGKPCSHLSLAGLLQGDDVEVDFAMSSLDDGNGQLNLDARERIEGVGEVGRHGGVGACRL